MAVFRPSVFPCFVEAMSGCVFFAIVLGKILPFCNYLVLAKEMDGVL